MVGDPFNEPGARPGRLDPADNPFAIAPGQIPPTMAGRDELLAGLRDQLDRIARRMPSEWWIIEGHHGLGKTALLHRVAEAAGDRDVEAVVIDLAAGADGIRANLARYRFLHGGADGAPADLGRAVGELVRDAESRLRQTCVLLDNVHDATDEAVTLLRSVDQVSAGRGAAGVLIGGRPGTADQLASSLPGAERLPVHALELLGHDDVGAAIAGPFAQVGVGLEPDVVTGVTVHSHGHPHDVQLWGRELWRVARPARSLDRGDVEAVAPRVQLAMDQLHRQRWARLDAPSREYVAAVARLGSDRATPGDIAGRLGDVGWDATEVHGRLARAGIVASNERGQVELTMPRMGEWVAARTAPEVITASWSRSRNG